MTAMPTPAEVMAFLTDGAAEMDQIGKDLEAAYLRLGEAEADWEEERDAALLEIVDEYARKAERLPGEDVRNALVRQRVGGDRYRAYRRAKREAEGLEKKSRKLETAITARMSTLKGLQEEAKMPTPRQGPERFDPRTGEVLPP